MYARPRTGVHLSPGPSKGVCHLSVPPPPGDGCARSESVPAARARRRRRPAERPAQPERLDHWPGVGRQRAVPPEFCLIHITVSREPRSTGAGTVTVRSVPESYRCRMPGRSAAARYGRRGGYHRIRLSQVSDAGGPAAAAGGLAQTTPGAGLGRGREFSISGHFTSHGHSHRHGPGTVTSESRVTVDCTL